MVLQNPMFSSVLTPSGILIRLKKSNASSVPPPPPPPPPPAAERPTTAPLRAAKSKPYPNFNFQPPPPDIHEYNSFEEEEDGDEGEGEWEEEEEEEEEWQEEGNAVEEEEEGEDAAAGGESVDGEHPASFSDDIDTDTYTSLPKALTFSDISRSVSPDQLPLLCAPDTSIKPTVDHNLTTTPASANRSDEKKIKTINDPELQLRELQQLALERQMLKREQHREDEVAILQSLVEFSSKKGKIPSSSSEMDAFHEFLKRSLKVEVTRTQLAIKIRRLKKNYEKAAARGKDGMDPSFKIAHNWSTFALSKQIWGRPKRDSIEGDAEDDEDAENDSLKKRRMPEGEKLVSPREPKRNVTEGSLMIAEADDFLMGSNLTIPLLKGAVSKMTFKQRRGFVVENALEMLDGSEAVMLEEKYKKQLQEEMLHNMQHMDLLKETMKLFMDALNK